MLNWSNVACKLNINNNHTIKPRFTKPCSLDLNASNVKRLEFTLGIQWDEDKPNQWHHRRKTTTSNELHWCSTRKTTISSLTIFVTTKEDDDVQERQPRATSRSSLPPMKKTMHSGKKQVRGRLGRGKGREKIKKLQ